MPSVGHVSAPVIVGRFLAEIDRGRLTSEIALRPLTPSQVEHLLPALLDLTRPAGAVFVRARHGLTGGNPFFVEDVLRSLIAGGSVYPAEEGWLRERKPEATGFIADYALKSERVPGEWLSLVIFDTVENYRKNAADPEQHRQYEALRALLERDPEWNDGEIVAVEPASVPV